MGGYEVDDDQQPSPDKNQELEVVLTDQYRKKDGCGMEYTIVCKFNYGDMQKNLMVQTNNS